MTCVVVDDTIALMASLAQRLRWCIEHRGITARQLSLQAGLSAGTVQKILERDSSRVSVEDITRLADVAKVSRCWLALGEGTPDAVTPAPEFPDASLAAEVSKAAVEALGRALPALLSAGDQAGYALAIDALRLLGTGMPSDELASTPQGEVRAQAR